MRGSRHFENLPQVFVCLMRIDSKVVELATERTEMGEPWVIEAILVDPN